jgi:hypothetical protein
MLIGGRRTAPFNLAPHRGLSIKDRPEEICDSCRRIVHTRLPALLPVSERVHQSSLALGYEPVGDRRCFGSAELHVDGACFAEVPLFQVGVADVEGQVG